MMFINKVIGIYTSPLSLILSDFSFATAFETSVLNTYGSDWIHQMF